MVKFYFRIDLIINLTKNLTEVKSHRVLNVIDEMLIIRMGPHQSLNFTNELGVGRVRIEGQWYYADPSLAAGGQRVDRFLMGDRELTQSGYLAGVDYPPSELPGYLLPPS